MKSISLFLKVQDKLLTLDIFKSFLVVSSNFFFGPPLSPLEGVCTLLLRRTTACSDLLNMWLTILNKCSFIAASIGVPLNYL